MSLKFESKEKEVIEELDKNVCIINVHGSLREVGWKLT